VPPAKDSKFAAFAKQIVSVAVRFTNDCRDLIKIAASRRLFDLYDAAGDGVSGYAAVATVLKRAVDGLHDPYLDVDALVADQQTTTRKRKTGTLLAAELPVFARYLLLAAFVATYSPKDSDKQIFTAGSSQNNPKKRRKRDDQGTASSKVKKSDSIDDGARKAGPQAQPLDRILSIHAYVVANQLGQSVPVRSDAVLRAFAGLVKHKLIDRVHQKNDDLSQLKFKCLLLPGDAFQLADTLGCKLETYLPAAFRH